MPSIVFAPVCEDLKCKSVCGKPQECVIFPDYSTHFVLPLVEERLDFVECHSSLQLPNGKAGEKVGNPWAPLALCAFEVRPTVLPFIGLAQHHEVRRRHVGLWPNAIT